MSDSPAMRTLEHPLPTGMRDLLPAEAAARRTLSRTFLRHSELFGYQIVTPPAFEYASTFELGLGTLDPQEIVRFVEPESGEVVALRPDVTPQIARICATRLREQPLPMRLSYDATVVRRRSGSRARTQRQLPQVGVELVGLPGVVGDREMLVVATTALARLGIVRFTVDVGHAQFARSIIDEAPAGLRPALVTALARKDTESLVQLTKHLSDDVAKALVDLSVAHGDPSLLHRLPTSLRARLAGPAAALDKLLDAVAQELGEMSHMSHGSGAQPAPVFTVDLGEVRGLSYYSGPFFQLYAEGPGTALGGGGRYDELLSRFGLPAPATGFALDLEAVGDALERIQSDGRPDFSERKALVVTARGSERVWSERLCQTLRGQGIAAVAHSSDTSDQADAAGAISYAKAWNYRWIVTPQSAATSLLHDVETAKEVVLTTAQIVPSLQVQSP